MSVSDVFITDLEASDLKPATLEGMLHHPFQEKRSLPGSNKMDIRVVPFDDAAFGQRNECQIPAMDLIPHEMFCEITVSAATGDVANNEPFWVPTPTWLTQQGADLNYKEVSVYNMSEAECLMSTILDQRDNVFQSRQRLMAFGQPANAAAVVNKFYLPLNPLCTQVLSKVGPLSSYASNDWSVSVDLQTANHLLRNTANVSNVQTSTITAMNLIIIGSQAPFGEVAMCRDALAKSGVVWNFCRPNYSRQLMPVNNGIATPYSLNYTSVVGAVAEARLLIRRTAGILSTTPNTVNTVSYSSFYGINDFINVGKTENPYEVFGQNLSLPIVYSLFSARGTVGSSRYLAITGTGTPLVAAVDTGIIAVEFSESPTDLSFGTSTGSYPVKNNLRIDLNITSNTLANNFIDSVIYTHVRGVITAGTANINLSA
jgi:hypothetical protein